MKAKKQITITVYEYDNGYTVEARKGNDNVTEFWLQQEEYGIKSMMYGQEVASPENEEELADFVYEEYRSAYAELYED